MRRIPAIVAVLVLTPSVPLLARPVAWAITAVALVDAIVVELSRIVEDIAALLRSVRDLLDAARERS